jgi:transcriptional regulator with XRE-family HTH domain
VFPLLGRSEMTAHILPVRRGAIGHAGSNNEHDRDLHAKGTCRAGTRVKNNYTHGEVFSEKGSRRVGAVQPDRRPRTLPSEWHQIWYQREVDAAVLLLEARRRSGLSRRQLAERGGTSASTLSAYESGVSVPSVVTLSRLLRAAGFEVEANLRPLPSADERELTEKIEALFSFVDALPRRRRGPLRYPQFGVAATVCQ